MSALWPLSALATAAGAWVRPRREPAPTLTWRARLAGDRVLRTVLELGG